MKNISIDPGSCSSLLIEIYKGNTNFGSATAFIARRKGKYFLVTNRHIVTGQDEEGNPIWPHAGILPDKMVVFYNLKNSLGEYHKYTHDLISHDRNNWYEHPEWKEKADFVAIPIPDDSNICLSYCYEIDNLDFRVFIKPLDDLAIIGFPFGKTSTKNLGLWVKGSISSDMDIDYKDRPTFLIDCRTRPGNSGSPVLTNFNGTIPFKSEKGSFNRIGGPTHREFLGVYSSRIHKESDIGIVWKKKAICELLDSI